MKAIDRQRPHLPMARTPARRRLRRRLRARLRQPGDHRRQRAVARRARRPRHLPDRRLRRAVVHQPEQPVDRHRRAAVGARHLRQLFLRPRRRRRSDDERRRSTCAAGTILAAFADAGAKVAVITAKDKLRALLGHRLRASASRPRRPTRSPSTANGIADALSLAGMPVPSVYSAELSEFVFAAGVRAAGARPAGHHVPVDDRLRAAQARAGHADGQRVHRHARPLPRASRRAGRDGRRHGRPRHERQDRRVRATEHRVPAGRAR